MRLPEVRLEYGGYLSQKRGGTDENRKEQPENLAGQESMGLSTVAK